MSRRIAIVLNTSWNIYNFRLGLLRALQKEGYEVVAIAPRDAYAQKLDALGFSYHEIKINNKGVNPLEDLKLLWDFYQLYKRLQPDVLLHYTIKPNIYGTVAAKMLGIPVVSNISGLGTVFLDDRFSSKVARLLYGIALKVPYRVFFQNPEDLQLFIEAKLVEESKTDLLPGSGVDTQKFKPLHLPRKSEKRSFLFIARLLKDKGIMEYVEAARILKKQYDIVCYILGAYYDNNPTAIDKEQMQRWESEGIVVYLGVSDDVASHIASVDCVVLPSYREGLSRVLLEAAAMAKPLVSTNVAGCKDVVEDGVNGYLCEVKNSQSLAEAMQKILKHTDVELEQMGQRGRQKVVREFDEQKVIEKYLKIVAQILQQESQGA